MKFNSGLFLASILSASLGMSAELEPYVPAPHAPLDIREIKQPVVQRASKAEKKEVLSEFGGVLYMGLNKTTYEKWTGREMSDCVSAADRKNSEAWCQQCELITPHVNAFYSFYRDNKKNSCTLQEIDVRINVADQAVMKDLKKPIRSLFGKEEGAATEVASTSRWNAGDEIAHLFMEKNHAQDPGKIRFVWQRSPLIYSKMGKGQTTAQAAVERSMRLTAATSSTPTR